jgi:5-methylcytosine-specific restriction endonuclease McrA
VSERTCGVEGCERAYHSHGYCGMHWMRVKKFGDPGPVEKVKQLGRPRPRKLDFDHGTPQGYNHHKCRCADCKLWRSSYISEYHARRLANGTYKHGNEGYIVGCRCDVCCSARSASGAKHYAKNPDGVKLNSKLQAEVRRARQRGLAAYKVTVRDWVRLCRRFDDRCAYCGGLGPLHREHVVPVSRGGQHSIGNLLPACQKCNLSKGRKLLVEWRRDGRQEREAEAGTC